jgi:probable F420-dependent oxidoreductase
MRIFTRLPLHDWRATAQAARNAEAAGFDAVMSVELGHDVFAALAVATMATERVELTPSVAVAFPRSPTVLASQAWDLQANSRGRFVLGLGSQVKGHNERRFGIAWTAPAPRLRDYVRALRAIWHCWETRGKLDFHSEHYTLTLMTPDFSPEPTGLPMPPVTVAAVGEAMLRVAGQVADGVRLHPLCSRRYLEEVCLPQIDIGMQRSGRQRENFDVHGGGFVIAGPDDAAVAAGMEAARRRIGFYGSTRTYMPILALHDLQDLAGMTWRRRCPTTSCASSPPAERIPRSPNRSNIATAAWRTRSISNSRSTRRSACDVTCWPTSSASRTGSPASSAAGNCGVRSVRSDRNSPSPCGRGLGGGGATRWSTAPTPCIAVLEQPPDTAHYRGDRTGDAPCRLVRDVNT